MNRREFDAYRTWLRQVSGERAERDRRALVRSSLYQHERREAERRARRANRLLVVSVWVLTALVCCVTILTTTFAN